MDTVMLHYGTNKVRFCRLPAPPHTPFIQSSSIIGLNKRYNAQLGKNNFLAEVPTYRLASEGKQIPALFSNCSEGNSAV